MSKHFFRFYSHIAVYLGCCLVLVSCAPPKTPENPNDALLKALLSDNPNAIQQQLSQSDTTADSRQLIELYNLLLRDRHHQIADQSKVLLKRYNNLSNSQKKIAKDIISWAYIRKIYRQETARQVRIYQREELLVAPSEIDFKSCEQEAKHCANALRKRLNPLVSAGQLTEILLEMAAKDPCINLSTEDRAGEFASNCLATRKGNLKLVLLPAPQFTRTEWQSIL